jgi:hypothetical protein
MRGCVVKPSSHTQRKRRLIQESPETSKGRSHVQQPPSPILTATYKIVKLITNVLVNGFFYSHYGCSTSNFSSNMFLKQQTSTSKPTKVKLFIIPKLTCTQFAHSFKKYIAKVQKYFHVLNERKTQNQINIKSFLLDANLLS